MRQKMKCIRDAPDSKAATPSIPYSNRQLAHAWFSVKFCCIKTTKQNYTPRSSWSKGFDGILNTPFGEDTRVDFLKTFVLFDVMRLIVLVWLPKQYFST